jgi:predicted RNA binding protein YcfA (HicA-like mRNA interferase family)
MNGKELIKIFQKNGWVLDRITGSHHIMIKENERSVPIPVHASKDIPNGLVQKILKAGKIKT